MLFKVLNRYLKWRKKCKIWKEYGNHTKYHLTGPQFSIGEFTYGVPTIHAYDSDTHLTIGKYCSIAAGVEMVLGGNHHTDWVSTYAFYQETPTFPRWKDMQDPGYRKSRNIEIGNDVWIGRNALILSGAKIGDGSVIGAGAVVGGGIIPPYSIAVGNPAKVIKMRFKEEEREALQELEWWEFPESEINELLPLLCSSDISSFIEKARKMKAAHQANKT